MKRLLLLSVAFTTLMLVAQPSRQVYVTLDVSGSMTGNKYALANYTTQMIVALCNDQDDIHMIVYGQERLLSGEQQPLAVIQQPMKRLVFGKPKSRTSQFDDIIGFNHVYKPAPGKQDWLFIIGDGYWDTDRDKYGSDRQRFQENVKSGGLNVCYLQTGKKLSEHTDFTKFVEGLGVVDIRKSSTDPQTIMTGCDHFARKILGFSETSLDIRKSGRQAITMVAELPLSEFLLVYQDEVKPASLPVITGAQYKGQPLRISHKGTPTTLPVKSNGNEENLSGNVWRLSSGGTIAADTPIEITFNSAVDPSKVSIYPLVRQIDFGTFVLAPYGGELKQVADNTYSICKDEQKALVRVELSEQSKQELPERLLKQTKVVVKANNKSYQAAFKDGGFECTIDLDCEQTQYYAECDCPGYFSRVTPITTIVKGEDCQPAEPPVSERAAVDFGTMTFSQLKDDQIKGIIQDAETLQELDPANFDIDIEIEDGYLYEKPVLHIEGNKLFIDVKPKGDWCECLFPSELNMQVVSTPKSGAFGDKHYVKTVTPIHVSIVKDRPWLSRCLWVVLALVGLLLLVFYLRALLKKKRFKKNAMITPRYYSYYGELIDDQGGRRLRREGFGAWVSRWLLPGDEQTTLSFDMPAVSGLTLIASESKEVVGVVKSCCDWETMYISGYDPETDVSKTKTVKLGDMSSIEVTKPNGRKEGELLFSAGTENDGAIHRMLTGLLMVASLVGIAVLAVLLLQSL